MMKPALWKWRGLALSRWVAGRCYWRLRPPTAWLSARTSQPDAILVELKMRHDDGPEILRNLLAEETTRNSPVILLLERFAPRVRRNFDEPGVVGLIWKPFHAMDLPRQVAMLLGWRP